jgi:hypothetical protein
MDFFTGKAEVDRDEREHAPPEPRNVWESKFSSLFGQDCILIYHRNLVRNCMSMYILSDEGDGNGFVMT